MGKKLIVATILLFVSTALKSSHKLVIKHHSVIAHYVPELYSAIPLGAITPKGWLQDQLEIMLKGSSGHLDEIYAKLKDDNGWLGGKGDGWEETPYWLDGALPLAYLLNDADLKSKVLQYVNWTIEHQRPSGYFGPVTKAEREQGVEISPKHASFGDDWWPKMIMLKVLQQYYTATNDLRVIKFMTRYFHYQLAALQVAPLNNWSEWARSRGAENVLTAQWLYSITRDKSLLKLADLLDKNSYDWSTWFGERDWVIKAAALQNNDDWMHRHGVNVAMGLKSPVLNYQRTGDSRYLKKAATGFHDLMTLHGLPMGMFSADEDLHGNLPTQGTELCAIVETMFSLEQMIAITGNTCYIDALERITFNALPTQTTDDYNNKQYFQIPNQVQIAKGVFNFSLPFDHGMNNVLGMRSGYTCCLANMHQGWTKYCEHLWYKTADNGLAALVYGPNELKTTAGKNNLPVTISESTYYPFNNKISFCITTKRSNEFTFKLHIPMWCKDPHIFINGIQIQTADAGSILSLTRQWKNRDSVVLILPMQVTTSNWGRNSRVIERGPLIYALKLGEIWDKGYDREEGSYYTVHPVGKWNYGLIQDIVTFPQQNLKVVEHTIVRPFVWNEDHAPITVIASGRQLPEWKLDDGVANQPVTDREGLYKGSVSDQIDQLTLIPYGFTKVRIVAFPVVK